MTPRNLLKKPVPGTLRSRVPAPGRVCGRTVHAEVWPRIIAAARADAGRRARAGIKGRPGGSSAWSGGQRPGAVTAGQALAEQVAQVERGGGA